MEHLIGGIIGGAIAALFGAYISNIFTWKIKNRIDACDYIYNTLWKISNGCQAIRDLDIASAKGEEYKNLRREVSELTYSLHLPTQILEDKFTNDITKFTELGKKFCNSQITFTEHDNKELEGLFNTTTQAIIKHRNEITSFCYMFKHIFSFKALGKCCCNNKTQVN